MIRSKLNRSRTGIDSNFSVPAGTFIVIFRLTNSKIQKEGEMK